MDPRVKTSAAGLEKKFQAESRMSAIMNESAQALVQGRSMRAQLDKLNSQGNASTKQAMEASEKKLVALLGTAPGFLAPPSAEVTLSRVNAEAGALYQQIWQVDAEPSSSQTAAMSAMEKESAGILKSWAEFKSTDLPELNRLLRESRVPEVRLEADLHLEEPQVDEE